MSDPTHRLAETLLDLLPLAEQARTRGDAIVDGASAVPVRDIQAIALHEALVIWQSETRGQDLTEEHVTEVLTGLRDTVAGNMEVIAASIAGGRRAAYLDALHDLHIATPREPATSPDNGSYVRSDEKGQVRHDRD